MGPMWYVCIKGPMWVMGPTWGVYSMGPTWGVCIMGAMWGVCIMGPAWGVCIMGTRWGVCIMGKTSPRDHGKSIQHGRDCPCHSGFREDGAEEVAEGDEGTGQQPVEAQHDEEGGVAEGVQPNDCTQDARNCHGGEVGQRPGAPVG